MQGENSAVRWSGASLEVRYTDKPVSGWGGLVAVARYLEKLGIRELLERAVAPHRTRFRWWKWCWHCSPRC
jgi:hypothetical protein